MSPLWIFLCIGVFCWAIAGPPPTSREYREALRDQRARAKAARDAARTARQAWRRRVFGSHPHLYWSLAWFGVPVLSCTMAILMGW
jgi:alkanesulfonate monooxygenase SsuD/methylene tetrahydromethanopterin reductase-like flavin-dependent oxidoreductase (luciferase family)